MRKKPKWLVDAERRERAEKIFDERRRRATDKVKSRLLAALESWVTVRRSDTLTPDSCAEVVVCCQLRALLLVEHTRAPETKKARETGPARRRKR